MFFDGSDERIELTNDSDIEFNDSISLTWVKRSWDLDIVVRIEPFSSIYIWDKVLSEEKIWSWSLLNQWFVVKDVPDDWVYNIWLQYTWSSTKYSFISDELVTLHNDVSKPLIYNKESDERYIDTKEEGEENNYVEWEFIDNGLEKNEENNTLTWSVLLSWAIQENSWIIDSTIPFSWWIVKSIETNEVQNWVNNVWSTQKVISWEQEEDPVSEWSPKEGDISIMEVYPYDTPSFGEYVLLSYKKKIEAPYILIGWSRAWWEVLVDSCFWESWDIVLITDSPELLIEDDWYTICVVESLSLTDLGQSLSITNTSWFVFDYFTYTWSTSQKNMAYSSWWDNEKVIPYPYSVLHASFHASYGYCSLDISSEMNIYTVTLPETICKHDLLAVFWTTKQNNILTKNKECEISFDTKLWSTNIQLQVFSPDNQWKILCENNLSFNWSQSVEEITDETVPLETKVHTGSALIISEIYPFDFSWHKEYIEIFALDDYLWSITLSWLWSRDSSKTLDIDIKRFDSLLISDDSSIEYTDAIVLPSITLTDSWEEIILRGQDGQIMDRVVYSSWNKALSYTDWWLISSWARIFDNQTLPSPWFSNTLLADSCEQTPVASCSISLQGKKESVFGKSVNFIVSIDGDEISNAQSNYNCSWSWSHLPSDFDFNACNPTSFTYEVPGIHEVEVEVYRDGYYFCTIDYSLNLPEPIHKSSSQSTVSQKNDTSTEKNTQSTLIKSVPWNTQELPLAQPRFTEDDGLVSIVSVLPNPEGADSDFEWIELLNLSDNIVNLEDIYIDNWKSTTWLMWTLLPYEQLTITQKLWLYNSPSCIRIWKWEDTLLDELCYPKPKNDIRYSHNSLNIADLGTVAWQSNLSLLQENWEICVVYNSTSLFCKKALANKDDVLALKKSISTYKKDNKKLTSTVNKLTKKETSLLKKIQQEKSRAEKWKDKLRTQRISKDNEIAVLKQEKRETKLLINLHEEFIYESIWRLRGPRQPVYEETDIAYLYNHRRSIQSEFNNGAESFEFGKTIVNREDLVLAYKIRTQTVWLGDMPVVDLYWPMLRSFRDQFIKAKENLANSANDEKKEKFIYDYNRSIFDKESPSAYLLTE